MKKIMLKKWAFFWLIIINLPVFSQTNIPGYPALLINDSLKTGANAVLREEMLEYQFITQELNILRHRKVITVLNKNGDKKANFSMVSDKFRKITYCRGNIFNADGKLIRKIKPSEIEDVSASAGQAEFSDIRYKSFEPLESVYPFTVEFEYEIQISGSLFFPEWMAFEDYNVSIEKAVFKVTVPNDYELHYKEFNIERKPEVTQDNKNKTLQWTAENIKAIDREPFSEELIKYVGAVYLAPSTFFYSGYSGSMDSWNDYAKWIGQLNKGRDLLSEIRASEIKELIKDVTDKREIVRLLYKYMQNKTRYFNVSLGIGGLQPADAKNVDEVGYGDCKGLSNYMKALLKVAGIESFYTLVLAGNNYPPILSDFPSQQFNHAILCVPIKQDTVWLECTSQVMPFGFLGDFTSDRYVLLINDDGGKLVRTPAYPIGMNIQITKGSVLIMSDGTGKATVSQKLGGLQYQNMSRNLYKNLDDQKTWLYSHLSLPDYLITKFSFSQATADIPECDLDLALNLNNYGSLSGKRLFLALNLVNRNNYIPEKLKERKRDFIIKTPYLDIDTIEYIIPEGMKIEFLPDSTLINAPFGEYISRVLVKDNKIYYYRQVKMFKGTYQRDQYQELIKFYSDISNADKCQAILIKEET